MHKSVIYKMTTSENIRVICCRIIAFCMFQTILAIFLGKFTFSNPDTSNCWVVPDTQTPYTESQGIEGEFNMSTQFHYWFLAGFVACCVSIVIACVEIICVKNYCIQLFAKVL